MGGWGLLEPVPEPTPGGGGPASQQLPVQPIRDGGGVLQLATNSWNEQRYSVGIQWPYKHKWLLDTYYLRQNCSSCDPAHLNVGGLSLSFFFGTQR